MVGLPQSQCSLLMGTMSVSVWRWPLRLSILIFNDLVIFHGDACGQGTRRGDGEELDPCRACDGDPL